MSARLCAAVATLAVALPTVGVADAQARFVVNRSMEGVAIGMSSGEVRERLGEPVSREAGPDFATWHFHRPPIEVTLKPDVVTLHTTSETVRGPRSIGVGTRERRLRAVLGRRVRCTTTVEQRLCIVGSFRMGRRSTVFEMARRQVTAVTISRSVD
ncbi:MAG: hypothetical protein AVDCRST_MAG38-2522 [uncultured Solirubrobacteraceae bacterium]|uniref:Lipoprotein SmpA/OmlA domain-containing protein n=1 Tax=uncultured Solirubrobacteraceae bacterium TaxID=1162706 RepID=A0A6J4SCL8_9ACTN|nr:MAG: hypothetical protein AVDCRST_MAG38-2522 [uncultured Solirubrobacteraceae bacterium]